MRINFSCKWLQKVACLTTYTAASFNEQFESQFFHQVMGITSDGVLHTEVMVVSEERSTTRATAFLSSSCVKFSHLYRYAVKMVHSGCFLDNQKCTFRHLSPKMRLQEYLSTKAHLHSHNYIETSTNTLVWHRLDLSALAGRMKLERGGTISTR